MTYKPTSDQIAFWETATGEPFAVPHSTSAGEEFSITCPGCQRQFRTGWLESSDDGEGANLAAECSECGLLITELIHGAAIFKDDVLRAKSGKGVGIA